MHPLPIPRCKPQHIAEVSGCILLKAVQIISMATASCYELHRAYRAQPNRGRSSTFVASSELRRYRL